MLNQKMNVLTGLFILALLMVGCGGSSIPDAPDGTIKACATAFGNNNPGVLWEAMPASYQKDVTTLVHEAADKMDKDIYDNSFVILNKTLDVLKDKKDFILEYMGNDSGMGMMIPDQDGLTQNWDHVVDLLRVIADSDIKSLDSLKSLDVGRFMDKTGSKLMDKIEHLAKLAPSDDFGALKKKLATLKVEVVSMEGDKARISMQVEGEATPDEETMVKVEGKWIPEEMAAEWKEAMAEAKRSISEMTGEEMKQQKPMIMGMMAGIEAGLDQLAEAKTAEEFAQTMEQLMGNMMGF